MLDTREVLDRIKKMKGFKTDTELSKDLGIKYITLRTWLQRNTLNYSVIIEYAIKNNIDLNLLFNKNIDIDSILIEPNDPNNPISLLNQAIIISNEEEVKICIKEFILTKIFNKIFKEQSSFSNILNQILLPKQKIILLFYLLIKHIVQNKEFEKISNESNSSPNKIRKYLIEKIHDFTPKEKMAILTKFDKVKLISQIEKLSNEELIILTANLKDSLPVLENFLSMINKLTFT